MLEGEARKDTEKRREMLNSCELAVLCLPDAASRESVAMIENPDVRVVDTSTAHRVAPGWAYGFPELGAARREAIISGKRVASPGCHAGGFIVLVQPLIEAGILPADALLSCHSLTGYSGGGKGMIAEYEAAERPAAFASPREYGLSQTTSTCPRWRAFRGSRTTRSSAPSSPTSTAACWSPCRSSPSSSTPAIRLADVRSLLRRQVHRPGGQVRRGHGRGGFIASNALAGTDAMEVAAFGNDERMILCSRFDNLGKGASGAAVQCINLMLGADETAGLVL